MEGVVENRCPDRLIQIFKHDDRVFAVTEFMIYELNFAGIWQPMQFVPPNWQPPRTVSMPWDRT